MKAKKKLYKKGGAMVKSQDRAKKLVKKGKELIFDKAGRAAEEGKYKKQIVWPHVVAERS